MGCIASKPGYIDSAAGGEKEYLTNYLEGETLGQVRRGKTREHLKERNDDTSICPWHLCHFACISIHLLLTSHFHLCSRVNLELSSWFVISAKRI